MTRVAEVWNTLTDEQQLAVGTSLRLTLGDLGVRLVIAIARDSAPPPPAEPATAPPLEDLCEDCRGAGPLKAAWDFDRHEPRMVCDLDYQARMYSRLRAPMPPGDVLQAFPTPFPPREHR